MSADGATSRVDADRHARTVEREVKKMFPRRDDATNKELILTLIDIQGYLSRYGKSHTNWHETLNEVIERLEQVEGEPQESKEAPQRMRGRWIGCDNSDHWKCSVCGTRAAFWFSEESSSEVDLDMSEWLSDFCPNCGSYNGGEQDVNC